MRSTSTFDRRLDERHAATGTRGTAWREHAAGCTGDVVDGELGEAEARDARERGGGEIGEAGVDHRSGRCGRGGPWPNVMRETITAEFVSSSTRGTGA